jgi:glycosyltransferase involved in cell wall biosynthesis
VSAAGNILLVWDRIGDYHRARVTALEALAGAQRVFTADLGSADGLYQWRNSEAGARHTFLSAKPVDAGDFLNRLRAFRRLLRERRIRHLGLAGYGRKEYLAFILLGRLHGCRITLFAESWYGTNPLVNRLKGLFLRGACHAFLVSGERARAHFRDRLGIPAARIETGYSTVDNAHFTPSGEPAREPVVLCVARFSPEKDLGTLIRAFQASRLAHGHRLRLIGGGPERARLTELIHDRGRVQLADWVSYDALPGEYQRARFFVLPSRFEPWGLVVNEAMAAGLPVVVSDACGCQPDLVGPANGRVFAAGNTAALQASLDQLADLTENQWMAMSAASQRTVARFSCAEWASRFMKGVG